MICCLTVSLLVHQLLTINKSGPYLPGEGDVLFADGAPVKIHLIECWWVISGVFWVRVGCGVVAYSSRQGFKKKIIYKKLFSW